MIHRDNNLVSASLIFFYYIETIVVKKITNRVSKWKINKLLVCKKSMFSSVSYLP